MGVQDYIAQVLSATGADAVPYAQHNKWHVQEHLVELQQVFPSLAVRLSDYHTNDGRLLHLLKAEGTIPIHYQGNKYNIPIAIWVSARYPDEPPMTYVMPTATMIIKSGHPHVNRNGEVSCSALRTWSRHNSNLVGLSLELSQIFGNDPPLYSQPPQAASNSSPALSSSQAAGSAAALRPQSGPVQPPAGYPAYSGGSYGASSTLGPGVQGGVHRPNSSPALAAMQGAAGGPPQGYGYSMPSTGTPPPPPTDVSAIAASNPLWGAAYAASVNPSRPPPPGMGSASLMQPGPEQSGASGGSQASVASGTTASSGYPSLYGQPIYPPGSAGAYPGQSMGSGQTAGYGPPPPPPTQPPKPKITPAEVAGKSRHLVLHALKLQIEAAEKAWAAHAAGETNALLEEQRTLSERRAGLQAVVAALKAEREGTEGLVSEMGGKQAQLVAWLARNEPKAAAWKAATADGAPVDWVRVLPAVDELSRQALETQAADLAAEDTVLALDKALHAGLAGLPLDLYLKQVRSLCRRQFSARALGLLVSSAQQQLPPPPRWPGPGMGVSPPLQLHHGDSWVHGGPAAQW